MRHSLQKEQIKRYPKLVCLQGPSETIMQRRFHALLATVVWRISICWSATLPDGGAGAVSILRGGHMAAAAGPGVYCTRRMGYHPDPFSKRPL